MSKFVENNLNKNEEIVLKAKLNPIFLVGKWIVGILFCWLLLIPFFKAIGATITYCNTELAITNKRVIGKVGFADSKSLDAPLNKIQSSSSGSTLFGKIFNYGWVKIDTAAGKFTWSGVKSADAFKRTLMGQIEQYEEDRVKEQAMQMAEAMKGAIAGANKAE